MALLSLLLSFIGKKIGSILQAIFGWSITALFGRLDTKRQLAVTGALILSLAWPFFVVGLFLPGVAGWALAILPLEKWLGLLTLRIIWAALACVAPLMVGALVHWAAPSKKTGFVMSLVHGYPLAVGFFAAFIVTAVTVPIVKLVSALRGWSDEHVYVQPRTGHYDQVLRDIAEAVARAGILPEITLPSRWMRIATDVLRTLARGAVSPIIAEEVRMVRGKDLQIVLYPADLLVRGSPAKVALARAMLTRTSLEADAYLVPTQKAQCIQDELRRLHVVLDEHEKHGTTAGTMIATRLVEVWHEMNHAELPFEEWVMLESIARRIERRLVRRDAGKAVLPLDREDDDLAAVAAAANDSATLYEAENKLVKKELAMESMESKQVTPERLSLEEASTADLVREALDEAKELVKIEVELAKDEVKTELSATIRAAIGFGVALAAAIVMLSMLGVALVFALGGGAIVALSVAGGFLVVAGVAGYVGYSMLPKKPLERTRSRVEADIAQLKEHIA